jgi:ubiquinone/menaquinone biosynthesis C-methylase UbiE
LFDRAVAASPEASVAMYSLGDGHRLQKATDELVRWLCERQLLAPALEVLDLGCGIGRIAAAVAPSVRWVLGSEISAGMIKQAQARCARVSNISFVMTSGRDLATLANAVFDLVLAVDSFPYLMQAGVAVCHMAEAWRVLRPAGRLVVLNLSYRGCPEADDDDARAWAQRFGFRVLHAETTPFSHWDGSAYVFQRA